MVQRYKSYLICAMGCVFLGEGERVLFYKKDTSYLFNDVQEVFIEHNCDGCRVDPSLSLVRLHAQ
jgi:hypothetical protein